MVALGTLRKIEVDNFVEHFGAERRAKILLVPGLSTYFAFDFIPFFVFLGWWLGFNNIGGRRLGRVAGVLSQCGDLFPGAPRSLTWLFSSESGGNRAF